MTWFFSVLPWIIFIIPYSCITVAFTYWSAWIAFDEDYPDRRNKFSAGDDVVDVFCGILWPILSIPIIGTRLLILRKARIDKEKARLKEELEEMEREAEEELRREQKTTY